MQINQNLAFNLKKVATIKNREDRTAAFRALCLQNAKVATLAQWAYHPDVQFYDFDIDIDDTITEINDSTAEDGPAYRSIRMLKHLCVKRSPDITPEKRVEILMIMLRSMKPDDAEVFRSVIFQRKLPYKTMGEDFIKEAIPEMFQNVSTPEPAVAA